MLYLASMAWHGIIISHFLLAFQSPEWPPQLAFPPWVWDFHGAAFLQQPSVAAQSQPWTPRWSGPKEHPTRVSCPLPSSCATQVALCPRFSPCCLLTHVCFSGSYLPLSVAVGFPWTPSSGCCRAGQPAWYPLGLLLLPLPHTLSPQTHISRIPLTFCPALMQQQPASHFTRSGEMPGNS